MKKLPSLIKLTRFQEYFGSCLILTGISSFLNPNLSLIQRGVVIVNLLLLNAFAFAINDLEDADDDSKDLQKAKRNPISAKLISKLEAKNFIYLISLVYFASLLISNSTLALITGLLSYFIAFIYSYKPIRLKSIPVLDLISHGLFLGGLQAMFAFSAFEAKPTNSSIIVAILIFLISVIGDLNNEIRDHKVDRATNIKNTASILNLNKVSNFAHFITIIPSGALFFYLFFLFQNHTKIIALSLSLIAALIYYFYKKSHQTSHFYESHLQKFLFLGGLIATLTF